MRITESYLRQLKAPAKPVLLKDDLTPNLYIKHAISGRIAFTHRSRKGGVWRVHTIGVFPNCTLAEARVKALALNQSSEPLSGMTFGELLTAWAERKPNVPGIFITYGKQKFGSKKLASITTQMLVKALQEYGVVSPVSANRCLSQWRLAFDYAVHTGVLTSNPLHRVTKAVCGGMEVARTRTLSADEIRHLFSIDDPKAMLARFCLATACRVSEAITGYPDGDTFRVAKTKNKSSHWVHLNKVAKENLGLFPTAHATQVWLRQQGWGWTLHDCRRTASTLLHSIGVEPIVVERGILNHKLGGLLRVYNQHDYAPEKVDASKKLSDELERIVKGGA